ncbi:unnamed protein product [Durusdinium trenchii]|uniref:Uncharacterized protein n=2 Tax=Durusdinium trenchii TaxID=1381693 RepID=A0ABP0LKM2_9DINO
MRQRRPLPQPDEGGEVDPAEVRRRAKQQEQEMAPYVVGAVLFIALGVAGLVTWWHPNISFHRAPVSKLDMEKEEVLAHLRNHTILHVGGVHYSGLTLLSELLVQHPQLAGMRHQEGADKRKTHWVSDVGNDGVFLQTVIPNWGTDHKHFALWKSVSKMAKRILPASVEEHFPWMKLRSGIGRFALNPEHHLDDSTWLIRSSAQVHLFSEWALFWDLSKKVLLEKSPSNVVLSPFLHRLWSLDLNTQSPGRFIFQQRHPLAVAIATRRRLGPLVDDLSMKDLMENWLAAEERRAKDMQSYFEYYGFAKDVFRIVQFEDLIRDPEKVVSEIFAWLGLSLPAEAIQAIKVKVRSDVNVKHFKQYCNFLVHGGHQAVEEHHRLVKELRDRVKAVSAYDLAKVPQLCREVLVNQQTDLNYTERQQIETVLSEEEASFEVA